MSINPPILLRRLASVILLCCFTALAAEVIPPPPTNHFNDFASVVSPQTAAQLNGELKNFERDTGNQVLVAVFPKMQSDSSIEDYTQRVAQSWKVGRKATNNGAVLFVFIQDHKMFLQVGYGLEGALPDALAKQIIENEIKPRFKENDFDGGLTAGVHAIIAATRGEYKGTGKTVAESQPMQSSTLILIFAAVLVFGVFGLLFIRMLSGRGGRGGRGGDGWMMSSGGSSIFSSGGGGGGGGSFSGGGGSFGGGGAGGSW